MATGSLKKHNNSQLIPSFLEIVSKLDSKVYSWSISSDNGKLNLEIVDKTETEFVHENISSNGLSEYSEIPARGKIFSRQGLKTGFPVRRHLGVRTEQSKQTYRTANLESKIRSDKSANLEPQVKDKHKSPSELRRDHRRLRTFISEKDHPKICGQDRTCQTSLETSDSQTQTSVVTCENQTLETFNPPRLESSALKVAVNQCCLGTAYKIIGLQKDRIDLDREQGYLCRELVKNSAADIKELKDKVEEQTIEIKKRDLLIQSRDLLIQQCQQASAVAELNALSASIHQIQTEATTTVIQPPEVDPTVCWNPPCKVTGCTKKCTACSKAVYCGKNCQTAHWKQHKRDSCRK